MYTDSSFDAQRTERAARRVVEARDEFLQFASSQGTETTQSLFAIFDHWLSAKNAEMAVSPFVIDPDTSWEWFLEHVPSIYLAAIDRLVATTDLESRFDSILPRCPGGGTECDDHPDLDRVAFLLQGASLSWPSARLDLERRT